MVSSIMTCIARLGASNSINRVRRPAHSFLPISYGERPPPCSVRRLLEVNDRSLSIAHVLDADVLRVIHNQGELSRNGLLAVVDDGHYADRNVHSCQLGESLFIGRTDRDDSFERGLDLELVMTGKLRPTESEAASCDSEATDQHGHKYTLEMIATELARGVFHAFERFVHSGGRLLQGAALTCERLKESCLQFGMNTFGQTSLRSLPASRCGLLLQGPRSPLLLSQWTEWPRWQSPCGGQWPDSTPR